MTVVYFGPLTCSIITTTRKFFTILASVILFANPISPLQWVGTVLVFLGKLPAELASLGTRRVTALGILSSPLKRYTHEIYVVILEKTFLKEKRKKKKKRGKEASHLIHPS